MNINHVIIMQSYISRKPKVSIQLSGKKLSDNLYNMYYTVRQGFKQNQIKM